MPNESKRRRLSEHTIAKGREFHALFPSEIDALLEIYRLLQIDISVCNICLSKSVDLYENQRMLKCRNCGESQWLTNGTFFEKMKHPKLWLIPIWFDNEGATINANQLHIISGAAYSSASNVMKKFDTVKMEVAEQHNAEDVQSCTFIDAISKRSRETPARHGPKAEEWQLHEAEGNTQTEDNLNDSAAAEANTTANATADALAKLDDEVSEIYSLLSDTPLSFDAILKLSGKPDGLVSSSIGMLEIYGLTEKVNGLKYVRSTPKQPDKSPFNGFTPDASPDTRLRVDTAVEHIRQTFDGISRKYLQLYVANFWFHSNWCETLKDQLLSALRSCRPIRRQEIIAYVTPQLVRFPYPMTEAA